MKLSKQIESSQSKTQSSKNKNQSPQNAIKAKLKALKKAKLRSEEEKTMKMDTGGPAGNMVSAVWIKNDKESMLSNNNNNKNSMINVEQHGLRVRPEWGGYG